MGMGHLLEITKFGGLSHSVTPHSDYHSNYKNQEPLDYQHNYLTETFLFEIFHCKYTYRSRIVNMWHKLQGKILLKYFSLLYSRLKYIKKKKDI